MRDEEDCPLCPPPQVRAFTDMPYADVAQHGAVQYGGMPIKRNIQTRAMRARTSTGSEKPIQSSEVF